MNEITTRDASIPRMSEGAIANVRAIEARSLSLPQVKITTHHVIHAGVYSRTICIPKGIILTGALMKVPTTLTVCGKASVLIGEENEVLVDGYHVFAASAGRKQGFIAHEDTWITMSFKTNARAVVEAEEEFTDEADLLFSRHGHNVITITGE